MKPALLALTLTALLAPAISQAATSSSTAAVSPEQYAQVLAGSWRVPQNALRDQYRHPQQTLSFFGLKPNQTLIEITPGNGWYSELLAPLLRDHGQYIAAVQAPNASDYARKNADTLQKKFSDGPSQYAKAQIVPFDPKAPSLGAAGSADTVLTFRNVHNWVLADTAPQMFQAFFRVLKPGGVLGVVDHRAHQGASLDEIKHSGYLPTEYVVKLATDAGFKLDAQSEINANPKDTKDYPDGVWTLPPALVLGDKDRAKYQAIGESDRMTLRFIKP
ncbi:methyltransferase domain-containing protein [Pseudomonas sp. SZMC_28357]|uniref:class I SAM-dependent methyltransferase n=1 Tax=Pseudomonas sp. SZMC_28357 TaxID=3074380 RepID=UPI0028719336|nr:methyltransferase domain-containing protein [Pseudomonas sp. SZMC_28357]MDR9753513.1 methyltransferase domain-containing protein [Pseudomonas sp. SZMC_28357]